MRVLLEKIKSFFSNTLYYPGCLTRFALPEIQKNYERILDYLGVDFVTIDEIKCCGSPVINAGYRKDYERLVKENQGLLKEYGVSEIVTNCPACYHMLKNIHPNVKHITQIIAEKIGETRKMNLTVTYHDPCHLGRYAGIYNEPREILKKCVKDVLEMDYCKERSLCCGGGGGFRSNYTELSRAIARKRVEQAKDTGADVLVTSCPMCYLQLKEVNEIKVMELSEVVAHALGLTGD